MSKEILKFVVVLLAVLILLCFFALIYGLYIKIGKKQSNLENKNISFNNLAKKCWEERISLSSTGFYKTPKIHWDQNKLKGRPYFYYTWGASVSESILDIETGETRILNAYIVEDCGKSLNEAIDIGQVEGGFVQGLGWLSCEELFFNQSGK